MSVSTRSRTPAHEHLRAATSASHRAVEAALDLPSPVTVEAHRRLLEVLLAVFAPVEDVLARWRLSHPAGWAVQQRSSLAESDLRRLTGPSMAPEPTSWPVLPPPEGPGGVPEALGYAYALEGSRLGGAVIRRRLATAWPGAPVSFFDPAERGRWRTFLSVLEGALAEERARERAACAASSVFDELVSQAGRRRRG